MLALAQHLANLHEQYIELSLVKDTFRNKKTWHILGSVSEHYSNLKSCEKNQRETVASRKCECNWV